MPVNRRVAKDCSPEKIPNSNSRKKCQTKTNRKGLVAICTNFLKDFSLRSLVLDPNWTHVTAIALIFVEIAVNFVIIEKVKYTEIDWSTYMQQVQCFLNGTLNYSKIEGSTGPIVYPAGHLYVYTALYFITDFGNNLKRAQHLFALLYVINLMVVFRIYVKSKKVPPYALVFMCCTSHRIHSIYVLRMFNDPIAMLFLYLAINLFIDRKWSLGCIIFSVAASIKMNILLFAPGLLLLLLENTGFWQTIKHLSICALTQLVIGLPFLWSFPVDYISRSFNFGRIFLYEWTVNWRFIPEEIFLNRYFHAALLCCHIFALILFFWKRWISVMKLKRVTKSETNSRRQLENTESVLSTLFVCNLIGIAFSRSLHYQFYCWYFHSLPFLLWCSSYASVTKLCILGMIELCWNTYPSTVWSSISLHLMHFLILLPLFTEKATSKTAIKAQ